ncbi:hypothetical protein ABZ865_33920 [Streptomyces sp. NPDC047085]|uniref:hypothetical protein n=1 Tax=Streptomyces sp. NPDC047085 TaxID=3155140 RepID=UPI0033F7934E
MYNGGTSAVSIGSWKYVDNDTTHSPVSISSSSPSATSIPAGGYVTFNSTLGLGDNDSVFLLDNTGNTVDSVTWATDGAKPSDERCANGTGWFHRDARRRELLLRQRRWYRRWRRSAAGWRRLAHQRLHPRGALRYGFHPDGHLGVAGRSGRHDRRQRLRVHHVHRS